MPAHAPRRAARPRRDHPGRPAANRSRAARPRTDPARRAAYDVLRAVADRDAYANLLLPALLTERGLTGRDASFATELTYGTLRGRGSYDAILAACSDRDDIDPPVRDVLRLGAHQLLATRVGDHAAVATSVDLAKDVCGPRPSGFVNAVLRRVATRDLDSWIQIVAPDRSGDPSGYLAVRYSYPRWIVDAFRDALGPDAAEIDDALAAGNVRPQVVLALSPGADGPLPDGERTRWSPYGFRLAGGDPSPLVASGSGFQAAVQDEASQLAALALTRTGVTGQDKLWLDLCAGPGGKARLLGALAAERGARLVAADLHPHRARRVLDALSRAGGENSCRHRRRRTTGALAGGHVRPRPGRRPLLRPRITAPPPRSQVAQGPRRRGRARQPAAPIARHGSGLGPARRCGGLRDLLTASGGDPRCRHRRGAGPGRRHHPRRAGCPGRRPPAALRRFRATGSRFAQFWSHRHGTDAIFLALLRRNGSGAAEGAG